MTYQGAQNTAELQAILSLQAANLPGNISAEEALEQGFLSIAHELPLLTAMNKPYSHTIAKDGNTLAGYALTTTYEFGQQIPLLQPFFALTAQLTWQGRALSDIKHVLMGQVCVAKVYRGQGVFTGLYRSMQERMAPHFELIVTEISNRNTRSMRAHAKVGFEEMHRYTAPDGKRWVVVGLACV